MEPQIFKVRPEQLNKGDLNYFLKECLAKEFGSQGFFIVNETQNDRLDPKTGRKQIIKAFLVEARGGKHSIFFDVTDCTVAAQSTTKWGY